jgi:hypothetical protein
MPSGPQGPRRRAQGPLECRRTSDSGTRGRMIDSAAPGFASGCLRPMVRRSRFAVPARGLGGGPPARCRTCQTARPGVTVAAKRRSGMRKLPRSGPGPPSGSFCRSRAGIRALGGRRSSDLLPFTDTPPVAGCLSGVPASQWGGNDPHQLPRETPTSRLQRSKFDEANGMVYDVCGGQPCHSVGHSGLP